MSEGNGFTNKEILIRLEQKLDKALEDHEERIGVLEQFIFRVKGVAAAGAFSIPIVVLFLVK